MWFKKIKHNKAKFILLGIALLMNSIIVTLAIDFTLELKKFSEVCINEDNAADVFAIAFGANDEDVIFDDEDREHIEDLYLMDGKVISVPILADDIDVSQFYQIMLFIEDENKYFYLDEEIEGDLPKSGEVWISKTIAKSNNISIGDTVTLNYDEPKELIVSGIYHSSLTSTASLCVTPLILSVEDKDNFSEMEGAFIAIEIDDERLSDSIFSDNDYIVTSYSREVLQNKFIEISNLLGIVGALAAVIVFIVALVVVKYIVKNDIDRQIKIIGIYKCLGYRNKKIVGFYLIGYLVTGIVTTSVGSILALPFVKYMCNLCTEYVAGFELTIISLYCCGGVVIGMNLLLIINLMTALRKVYKITPVEAFNAGQVASTKRIPKSIIKDAATALQTSINNIFKYKKRSVMLLLVFVICLLMSFLFAKIAYSSYFMTDNSNLWFAVPKNNCYMFGNIDGEVVEWLNEQEEIKTYVYGNINYNMSVEINEKKIDKCNVTFDIFNDASEDKTGVLIDGKAPGKNEVVISRNLVSILGCKVGDKLLITYEDEAVEYEIAGTYLSLLSNYGIMMTVEGMELLDDAYISTMAFVTLENENDFALFSDKCEDTWRNITVDKDWFAMNNALSSVKVILLSVSGILIFVFVLVSIMLVVIILMIENNNKRRQFGVLKAMGFRNSYMVWQNIYLYTILGVLGVGIALAIHLMLSDQLLTIVLINAFEDSAIILSAFSVGFLMLLIITVLLLCGKIKNIKPIELMED